MSGIVFFMLVGRAVQERAWRSLSFHRDYKSYFPIAVEVLAGGKKETRSLHDLKRGDLVRLHHGEIIPADATLLQGDARIDYSFVSGESAPVKVADGARLYAGGRQTAGAITIQVEKPVAGSYLTSLWNHHSFSKDKAKEAGEKSAVHLLAKYFTVVLFVLAGITAIYWSVADASRIIPAVSAMLIVACPCALLLSSTFTNGAVLRALSDNGLYLRDAQVIETLGQIDHVVFDKTGTLTQGVMLQYAAWSTELNEDEAAWVCSVAAESSHPRSRALVEFLGPRKHCTPSDWRELPGAGIQAIVEGNPLSIGNAAFVHGDEGADVCVRIGSRIFSFVDVPVLRPGVAPMVDELRSRFATSLISGDNPRHRGAMRGLFGEGDALLFRQKPLDKLAYIEKLQGRGCKVLMIGDGLNDAGALQQSDAGITLADDINNFTPSCDAILDAAQLNRLPALLKLARWGRTAVRLAFAVSILYNITGLYYAVRGELSPMIAAILMPASTLSIVLIGVGCTGLAARRIFRQKVAAR
jgi:Cu+-exporting ATPase